MALTKVKAGNILLTTPGASSNDVTPATTQYVTTALANLADSAPSTLNTLNELAAALGDDANFSTTVTNSIAAKLPLAGGTLTGVLTGTEFNVGVNYAGKFNAKQSGADAYGIVLEASGTDAWLRMGHTGTYAQIDATYNSSAGHTPLQLLAGGSARIHIATDGNVGIGTTSPTGSGTVLHVNGSSTVADFHLTNSTSGAASTDGFVLRYSGLNAEFLNREAGSNIFYTSGTEKMRIDSSGNVVIPTAFTTAGTGILFRDGITAASSKYNLSILSHDHSGDGNADGLTINGYDGVSFSTGTSTRTERMRLDSSGNLMIGGTNPAPVSNNVAGISLRAVNGEAQISVAGAAALYLNSKTNDGALAYFRKDGGTIGALATAGGDLIIGSHNTCLRFDDSADDILPTDDGGVVVNNTLSLGSASARFKELWIGSSPLDDYEEGTYNATISCASGSITLYSSYTALRYTKIGRQVHIHGKLAMQAVSSPSGATNLNLPFASANDTNRSGVAANIMTGYFNGSAVTNGIYPIYGDIAEASSDCRLFIMLPPATNNLGDNHVAAGSDIHVNFTYTVQ